MLIDVITYQAENKLLAWLEDSHRSLSSILRFQFGLTTISPSESSLLRAASSVLSDYRATIFICKDGDVFIAWSGAKQSIVDRLQDAIYMYCDLPPSPPIHQYYDLNAHGETLRLVIREKLEKNPPIADKIATDSIVAVVRAADLLQPTPEQLTQFAAAMKQRPLRKQPSILIVEDQLFSRKLLTGMLESEFKVTAVSHAETGLGAYLSLAPDILFLDIELPDANGHDLAATIRRFDPTAFIVMVTANQYAEDVARARENGAKAYIGKPYSRQKIMEAIHKYTQSRPSAGGTR